MKTVTKLTIGFLVLFGMTTTTVSVRAQGFVDNETLLELDYRETQRLIDESQRQFEEFLKDSMRIQQDSRSNQSRIIDEYISESRSRSNRAFEEAARASERRLHQAERELMDLRIQNLEDSLAGR